MPVASGCGILMPAASAAAALSTVMGEPVSSNEGISTPLMDIVTHTRPLSNCRAGTSHRPSSKPSVPIMSPNMVSEGPTAPVAASLGPTAAASPQSNSTPPGKAKRKPTPNKPAPDGEATGSALAVRLPQKSMRSSLGRSLSCAVPSTYVAPPARSPVALTPPLSKPTAVSRWYSAISALIVLTFAPVSTTKSRGTPRSPRSFSVSSSRSGVHMSLNRSDSTGYGPYIRSGARRAIIAVSTSGALAGGASAFARTTRVRRAAAARRSANVLAMPNRLSVAIDRRNAILTAEC
mmetsp:Transcript_9220/g.27827  ORF Transcript_9220/g.27827 Transcript_9220/m.27827 type:complete len:292 (+) Transcript_9220:349-1224(+)